MNRTPKSRGQEAVDVSLVRTSPVSEQTHMRTVASRLVARFWEAGTSLASKRTSGSAAPKIVVEVRIVSVAGTMRVCVET